MYEKNERGKRANMFHHLTLTSYAYTSWEFKQDFFCTPRIAGQGQNLAVKWLQSLRVPKRDTAVYLEPPSELSKR